jgi:hypothetical protein
MSCPKGKIRNDATGRCVSVTGKIGQAIISAKNKKPAAKKPTARQVAQLVARQPKPAKPAAAQLPVQIVHKPVAKASAKLLPVRPASKAENVDLFNSIVDILVQSPEVEGQSTQGLINKLNHFLQDRNINAHVKRTDLKTRFNGYEVRLEDPLTDATMKALLGFLIDLLLRTDDLLPTLDNVNLLATDTQFRAYPEAGGYVVGRFC